MKLPPTISNRRFKHLRGVRYVVDFGKVAGKRLTRAFKTRVHADKWATEKTDELKQHGAASHTLTQDERVSFQAARDRLAAADGTIDKAVDFYLEHHKPLKEAVTLKRLLELRLVDMELTNKSDRYYQQLQSSCLSFIRGRELQLSPTVTRDEVKGWILGNQFAPKTQRVYLGDLRSLFEWGKDEKYLRVNPIAGEEGFISLAEMVDGEISCFDVEDCAALLKTALFGIYTTFDREKKEFRDEVGFRQLIGYVALAMFLGVRPHELKKTPVSALDLRERVLVVSGRAAKTNKRRVVELPPAAVMWLRLWRQLCPDMEMILPVNFDRRWKALRREAKLKEWPHDVLRHTAASFHYAVHQNAAALKSQLGHKQDEETLFRHYRAVRTVAAKIVTRKMGERFYGLTPRTVRLWERGL